MSYLFPHSLRVVLRTVAKVTVLAALGCSTGSGRGRDNDDNGGGGASASGGGVGSGGGGGADATELGTHFATPALTWPVPPGGGANTGFWTVQGTDTDIGSANWALVDLDADDRPDLVVTSERDDGGRLRAFGHHTSGAHWNVYRNHGNGFETNASAWRLPSQGGGAATGYWGVAGTDTGGGSEQWTTMDLDGDRLPDLVVTSQRDTGGRLRAFDYATNAAHWKVYRNDGAGFETSATAWSVPPGGGGSVTGYWSVAGTDTESGSEQWTTVDLDGDELPDLVVTSQRDNRGRSRAFDYAASSARWKMYRNNATRFEASEILWPVPPNGGGAVTGYWDVAGTDVDKGSEQWTLIDLDGDHRPDLNVTSKRNDVGRLVAFDFAVKSRHWQLYRNEP
jgi:hypothetical protein